MPIKNNNLPDPVHSKAPKSKVVMYQNQLDRLGFASLDAMETRLKSSPEVVQWAYVVHDQDHSQTTQGGKVAPHVHVMMEFKSARSLSAIAKTMNDPVQQNITLYKPGTARNGYLYLTHRTAGAMDKYQYSFSLVKASFNYAEWAQSQIDSYQKHTSIKSAEKVKLVLDQLGNGVISLKEAKGSLSGSEYASAHARIEAVWERYQQEEALKWTAKMKANRKPIQVTWFFGPAGTGKTRAANQLASENWEDDEIFVSGSSGDPFQSYGEEGKFQHCVILDELRPNQFQYQDLLRILDPFINGQINASSRYHDKPLMAEEIIITSPYSPMKFYLNQNLIDSNVDQFDQLQRRVDTCLWFTESKIKSIDVPSHASIIDRIEDFVTDTIPNKFAQTVVKKSNSANILKKLA